jgi:Thioredoxin
MYPSDGSRTLQELFVGGETFENLLARPKANGELWDALYRRAKVSEEILSRAAGIQDRWHLLVLNEDWCGDSINTLPVVARLAESVPQIELRITGRDANPDVMDHHLTGLSRSIPVIMVLDSAFIERGWWGPRPRQLQGWVMEEGLALPKEARYREVRTWYARDRGQTALKELLDIIDNAESEEAHAEKARRNP